MWLRPSGERGDDEIGVIVTRIARNLPADPIGKIDLLVGGGQLHLDHDQAAIVAEKLVHLPNFSRVRNLEARLFDERPRAEREHLLGVCKRDGILKLQPVVADREVGVATSGTDPNGSLGNRRKVSLAVGDACSEAPPRV